MPHLSHENFKEQLKSQKELDILIEEELIEDFFKESNKKEKDEKNKIITSGGWVKKYGKKFREDIVEKHPELIELYRDDPAEAKKQIKKILYKK